MRRTLLHGSRFLVDRLTPHPSRVIDGELAVFATNERWLALAFIPKADVGIGTINGVPFITENKEGAFADMKVPGYIYSVSGKEFRQDIRLGMYKNEFITDDPVNIIHTEVIDDAFEALQREVSVHIVKYCDSDAFLTPTTDL